MAIADLTVHSRPSLRLVPTFPPRGEVCVLFDPGRTLVWLHGVIDSDLAEELDDAAADVLDAGLPVTIHAASITSCDGTALTFVGRLITAGLPIQIVDPKRQLRRALRKAVRAGQA